MYRLTIWLKKLVKMIVAICLASLSSRAIAQEATLTLPEAYRLSRTQYPLARQQDLILQTESLALKNISSAFLPQLTLGSQATYQSDVTQVNLPIPGIKIPGQTKDQYRVVAEVSQLLYDGGTGKAQKNLQRLNASLEERKTAVELYQFQLRISQIYFGILYQDELLKQAQLALAEIKAGIDKTAPQVANGTVLRSNLLVLQAQQLQIQQRAAEILSARKGLTDALSLFIQQPVNEHTQLQEPDAVLPADTIIARPELRQFRLQSAVAASQLQLVQAGHLPKASFFVQGGYGRPGLNLLSDRFEGFYLTGFRLNWSPGSLYNWERDKRLANITRQSVDVQQETFLLNIQAQLAQQKSEIGRFTALVATDSAIVSLREKIAAAAKAQLENAVITANDYIREVNAVDQARQALATHRLQLVQAATNYQLISGKL